MSEHREQTVAVVGAGVVGICSALELQRAGYQVTLFDKAPPSEGASYGNAGFLARELISPLAENVSVFSAIKMWMNLNSPLFLPPSELLNLPSWLVRFMYQASKKNIEASRDAINSLNELSIEAWKRLLTDIDGFHFLNKPGFLLLWRSKNKIQDAKNELNMMQRYGIKCELVNSAKIRKLEPELDEKLSHALYFEDAYQVSDPYKLCQALFSKYIERGGVFVQQEVVSIKQQAEAICLTTSKKRLFDKVVICAGAWSGQLLNHLKLSVPLVAERGYHVDFQKNGLNIEHLIASAENRFFISPLESGIRVVGISELGGLKLGAIKKRFKLLKKQGANLIPKLRSREHKSLWMGHRSTLPDSLPVIDRHPDHPNIMLAFGHQHLGFTQAAITAEILAQMMRNEKTCIDITPYSVTRF
jgi:D-amino-acid dehydrogenase